MRVDCAHEHPTRKSAEKRRRSIGDADDLVRCWPNEVETTFRTRVWPDINVPFGPKSTPSIADHTSSISSETGAQPASDNKEKRASRVRLGKVP